MEVDLSFEKFQNVTTPWERVEAEVPLRSQSRKRTFL